MEPLSVPLFGMNSQHMSRLVSIIINPDGSSFYLQIFNFQNAKLIILVSSWLVSRNNWVRTIPSFNLTQLFSAFEGASNGDPLFIVMKLLINYKFSALKFFKTWEKNYKLWLNQDFCSPIYLYLFLSDMIYNSTYCSLVFYVLV